MYQREPQEEANSISSLNRTYLVRILCRWSRIDYHKSPRTNNHDVAAGSTEDLYLLGLLQLTQINGRPHLRFATS
jgi:hypothetical protein